MSEETEEKLKLKIRHLLDAELNVEGKGTTILSAILKLEKYPIKAKERYALLRTQKIIKRALKQHGEFVTSEAERCGGEDQGQGNFKFTSKEQRIEFQEALKVAIKQEVEIPLTEKIHIPGISDGDFEVPQGAKLKPAWELEIPDLEMLLPIIVLPDIEEDDDEDEEDDIESIAPVTTVEEAEDAAETDEEEEQAQQSPAGPTSE